MVFDKTGTITYGIPMVTKVSVYFGDVSDFCANIFYLIGCAESNSEHPVATGIYHIFPVLLILTKLWLNT